MADPIRQLLSQTSYIANGSQTVWNFSFAGGYLDRSHVKAKYTGTDGIIVEVYVGPSAFLGPYQLSLVPAVPAGAVLTIYRDTPKDAPLVDFADAASLTEASLDLNAKQAVFVAAESGDGLSETQALTSGMQVLVNLAAASATSAGLSKEAALVAAGTASQQASAALSARAAIDNRYRGVLAADPATRTDGTPNQPGDYYAVQNSTPAGLIRTFVSAGVGWQTGNAVAASFAAPDGSSLMGFLQLGAGATSRTAQSKMRDVVNVKDFGAVGDGVTNDTAHIQAAIDATPIGGTLQFAPGTYLVDTSLTVKKSSDLDNNWSYGALLISQPMRIVGNKKAFLKLKDFSTAWVGQDIGDTIGVIIVNASNVHIDGLNIDANGNNHYETSGAFKYWETGPSTKRPPCGIIVTAESSQSNVEDVLIENCTIIDALAGVYFFGNALDAKRAEFLSSYLTTGVVKNSTSRHNTFKYLRGNGVIFNVGADNCLSDGDKFVNCMYHAVRMYSRAVNCRAINGRSSVNCDAIIARYNAQDNGYWRTNDPASEWFKIIRSGFHMGGADSYSALYGYSVMNCGFDGCTVNYKRCTTAPYANFFEGSSLYIGAFTTTGLPNCYIKNCVSTGSDYGVVLYRDALTPAASDGVQATRNKIYKSSIADIYVEGVYNASVVSNHVTISPDVAYAGAYLKKFVNGVFSGNVITGTSSAATYGVIVAGDSTGLALKDNTFSTEFIANRRYAIEAGSTPLCMYPLRIVNLVSADVITGGALSSGWAVAYPSPAEGQENTIRVLRDGTFTLCLRLSGAAATASTVATLAVGLRPITAMGFTATDLSTGAAYFGRVLTDGRIQVTLPVFPSAALTQVFAEVSYSVLL